MQYAVCRVLVRKQNLANPQKVNQLVPVRIPNEFYRISIFFLIILLNSGVFKKT